MGKPKYGRYWNVLNKYNSIILAYKNTKEPCKISFNTFYSRNTETIEVRGQILQLYAAKLG